MRGGADEQKIRQFLAALGQAVRGPGRVYLTGGATAVLVGWRPSTVDVDLHFDPEPPGAFEALARLKDELDLNVELAGPADFIPPPPGWEARSVFVARHGPIDFFHTDPYAQALAKIERGHEKDLADVRAMLERGLVEPPRLRELFAAIEPALIRYPALDPEEFRRKLDDVLRSFEGDPT